MKVDEVLGTLISVDCLDEGVVITYDNGSSLKENAKYGAAFGEANCMKKELGILSKEDIDYFLPKVELSNMV